VHRKLTLLKCKYAKTINSKNDLTQLVYAKINEQKRNFEQNISWWVSLRHCLARLLASCGTLDRCSRNPGWKSLP